MRRRNERRFKPPPSLPVEVHIMGDESLNILHARDISLSGLGVHVPHGFRASDLTTELDLVITLPGTRSFMAKGMVRHRTTIDNSGFFGVEFTRLQPRHRDEIRRFLQRLETLQPDDDSSAP